MNTLDTTHSNNYEYKTKHLRIHILGGLKTNKLESLRISIFDKSSFKNVKLLDPIRPLKETYL